MAIVWGSKAHYMQLGIEVLGQPTIISPGMLPPDPSGNNASMPKARVWKWNYTVKVYARSDSNRNFNFTGTMTFGMTGDSRTKSITYVSDIGDTSAKLLHTYQTEMEPFANRTRNPEFFAYLPITGTSSTAKVTTNPLIPKNPWDVPRVPKTPAVVRNSDTQATVTWVRDADSATVDRVAAAPWDGVRIDRWDIGSNKWVKLADVKTTGTSYVDKGIKANNQFRYRIRSFNADGYSKFVFTSYIETTPVAPSGITAERAGNDIVVSWTKRANYVSGYEIWDNNAKLADVGDVTTFRHVTPSAAVTHTYKLKTKSGALISGFSTESNPVQPLAPPNPPVNLATDHPVYPMDPDQVITMSWVHNPIDSSPQTSWQVETVTPLGTTQTFNPGGDYGPADKSQATIGFEQMDWVNFEPGEYKFRVRTKGEHANFSPWSNYYSFYMYDRPSALVTSPTPGQVWITSKLVIDWDFTDPQGVAQQSFTIELEQGGQVVYRHSQSTPETSFAPNYQLQDGLFYNIKFWATSLTGLDSNPEELTIFVDYLEPNAPQLQLLSEGDDGYNHFSITNLDDYTHAPTVTNRVYRNVDTSSAWQEFDSQVSQPDALTNYFSNPSFRKLDSLVDLIRMNYLGNGDMEGGTTPPSSGFTSGNLTLTYDTEEKRTGLRSMRASRSAAGTGQITVANNGWGVTTTQDSWTQVTSSAYVKGPVGAQVSMGYLEYAGPSTQVGAYMGPPVEMTGEWIRVYFTKNPLNAGNRFVPQLELTGPAGVVVHVDNWLVENSSQLNPYFNGEFSEDANITPEWSGTPYQSPSRGNANRVKSPFTSPLVILNASSDNTGQTWARVRSTSGSGWNAELVLDLATTFPDVDFAGEGITFDVVVMLQDKVINQYVNSEISVAIQKEVGGITTQDRRVIPNEPGRYPIRIYTEKGATSIRLSVPMRASGGVYYITQVGIYKGKYEGIWFDGDTPPSITDKGLSAAPAWTGEADDSPTNINYSFPGFIAEDWEYMGEYPPNAEVIDFKGLTKGKTVYMVEAISDIPSMARTLFPVVTHSPRVWISHGDTYEEAMSIFYNLEVSEGLEHPDAARRFFDGRPQPVLFNGVAVERSLNISGSVYPSEGRGNTYDELFELLNRPGPHFYRDMDGRRLFVDIEEFTSTRNSKKLYKISFKAVEVEYEEF